MLGSLSFAEDQNVTYNQTIPYDAFKPLNLKQFI